MPVEKEIENPNDIQTLLALNTGPSDPKSLVKPNHQEFRDAIVAALNKGFGELHVHHPHLAVSDHIDVPKNTVCTIDMADYAMMSIHSARVGFREQVEGLLRDIPNLHLMDNKEITIDTAALKMDEAAA